MKDNSRVEIRPASPDEMKSFYYGVRIQEVSDVYGAFVDGECIGMSGIMRDPAYFGTLWEEEGRMIGFLDIRANHPGLGVRAVRAIRSYLCTRNHAIYVQCDTNTVPQAERLLRLLGFSPTEEMETDMRNKKSVRVWKWQN